MNDSNNIDFESLFKERSLWQIFRASPSIWLNSFNRNTLVITIVLTSGFSTARLIGCIKVPWSPILLFSQWAELGLALSGTILGFLLAGFAVFLANLRPETVARLHQITRPSHNMSELKLLLIAFVNVFVHYVAFLFVCVAYIVLGGEEGLFQAIGHLIGALWPIGPLLFDHLVFVLWGTWFILLVLKLKSFIYNLYQSLVLVMADLADDAFQ